MKLHDWKTTAGGLLGALGLGTFATQVGTTEGQISLFLAALGVLLKGWASKDANPAVMPMAAPTAKEIKQAEPHPPK